MARKFYKKESVDERNPLASAILNFIIWGTGYLYNGKKVLAGVAFLLAFILSIAPVFYLGIHWYLVVPGLLFCTAHFIISLVLAVDAYLDARK